MPRKREISWQERLVSAERLKDFQAAVAADLTQGIAGLEDELCTASPAGAAELKKKLSQYRKALERLNRTGLEPRRHVTLWGLREVLCVSRPPILGVLLDWVFGGTIFDIQRIQQERGLTKKNIQNKLSILKHGCFQYRETGEQEVCKEYLDTLLGSI